MAPKRHGASSPFLELGRLGCGVRRSADSGAFARDARAVAPLRPSRGASTQTTAQLLVDRVLPPSARPRRRWAASAAWNSVVDKPTRSAQQTLRVPRGGLYAGGRPGRRACGAPRLANTCAQRFGLAVAAPAATTALEPSELLRPEAPGAGSFPDVFLITSTARLLPHALPTRLCSASFLEAMKTFAHRELADGLLRQYAPHEADSVRSICETLVHDLNGVNVWAAWVLVLYMLSDTQPAAGMTRQSPTWTSRLQ